MRRENSAGEIRIAFFLLDLDGGGAERAIVKLAGDIAKLGFSVDLVVGEADSDYNKEIDSSVRVRNFSTRSSLKTFVRLVRYLRENNPTVVMSALDLANVMLIAAAKVARYKGRTVISQRAVVDASLRELPRTRRALTAFLQRRFFPRADVLISNSRAAAKDVLALGVRQERVVTIHNALDIERIERLAQEAIAEDFSSRDPTPLIVSVGSLSKRKDMATLIRAFAQIIVRRPARLVIVGKGEEADRLSALISELKLDGKVRLIGFDANPYKWIAAAKIFVSASTGEGFPNVIAEALALGKSIVATDCPGDTAVLLEHGKWGRLVPVGDFGAMASALAAALDELEPPNSRLRAADFAPSRITSEYLNVLLPREASGRDALGAPT